LKRPLVVAVHGAVTNAASWLPLQRLLPEAFEFIAVDLPGHGTRRDSRFSIAAALQIIDAALPSTPRDRPTVLIGDSLGGYLALLEAARAGERVQCVVAAGASADLRGALGMLLAATGLPLNILHFFLGAARVETILAMGMRLVTDKATVEAVKARGLSISGRGESIKVLRNVDILGAIKSCKARVYLVDGAFDVPCAWNTRTYAGYAAHGYAVTISHAFHGCAISRPVEFADVISTAVAAAQVDLARSISPTAS
jgi:pimeloyl-ACP methyl ester carboxylesterase